MDVIDDIRNSLVVFGRDYVVGGSINNKHRSRDARPRLYHVERSHLLHVRRRHWVNSVSQLSAWIVSLNLRLWVVRNEKPMHAILLTLEFLVHRFRRIAAEFQLTS
jgi:hypothetical protein